MEFRVTFVAPDHGSLYHWDGPSRGLLYLKYAQERVQDLTANNLYTPNFLNDEHLTVLLTVEQAEETNHFLDAENVRVYVKNELLTPCIKSEMVQGDYNDWSLLVTLNTKKVFEAWKQAGYPLEWNQP